MPRSVISSTHSIPRPGRPIETFGTGGHIDLRENLGRDPETQAVRLTSPGVIYKDLMIVGGRVGEGLPTSPGDIRAYDVRSGALRWSFHTIPHPGEFGYDTWPKNAWEYSGAANNWPGMALDERRGLVYVPTGSAATDFYGADRLGDNLFANSLIALEAATGKRVWHYQFVRHDLWDRDLPSPPTLVTVRRGSRTIDAVTQATKHGFLFVFDRASGEPLFPIDNRTFPATMVPGDKASETQPVPTKPAAVRPAVADGGPADQPHAGGAAVGARTVQDLPQRGAIRPARPREADRRVSRLRRRCGMGRAGL